MITTITLNTIALLSVRISSQFYNLALYTIYKIYLILHHNLGCKKVCTYYAPFSLHNTPFYTFEQILFQRGVQQKS